MPDIEPVAMEGGTGLLITAREARDGAARTEQQLRHDAELLEFGDALCELDREFRVVRVNARQEQLTGIPRSRSIGKTHWELWPDSARPDSPWWREYHRCMEERVPVEFENYYAPLDLWSHVTAYPTSGGGIAIFFRDVTRRKRAEEELRRANEALRASEGRLHALVSASADVVYQMSADWTEMRQLRGQEFIADTDAPTTSWLEKYIPGEEQERVQAAIDEALRNRRALELEHRAVRADGSVGWTFSRAVPLLDARGAIVEWFGMATDVTGRRRAEEALREQLALKDQLARVAVSVPGVVYSYRRRPDGGACMPFTNAAAADVFGISSDVLARDMAPFMARVHPDDVHDLVARIEASATTLSPFHALFRYSHPANGPRWIEGWSVPNAEPDGSVLWHGFAMDVTERKRVEEEIRLANEKLRETDRRKDEFLGMLSHELRNPLAPIRNSTYILRHAEPGGEQARRAQAVIERQTEHLTRLVDDLLDVTRIARGKIELRRDRVDLRDLVWRAADDFRLVMRDRGVQLDVVVPDEHVWADVDATRITQLVGNLLHNASKFTRRDDAVAISLRADGGQAVIRVRDTGAGIDAALLPRVFDAFVQGERTLARTEGGLGLGLALVKGIAELHGGTVRAESAGMGKGAEFLVRVPLGDAARTHAVGRRAAAPANSGRRILVVDDNDDAAESLADLLKMRGHAVEVAYDGPSAVEKARACLPDVVLCDIGLPGMDGYEVAKALREAGTAAQLFAVTGYAQPEDVKRAIEAGFDGHVAKPCDPEQIERLLS